MTRTELKSKIIANRIAVLQNEELKAWRKVEEINKKRNEILVAYKRKQEEKGTVTFMKDLNRKSEIYSLQNREKVQASRTRKIKNHGKVKEMLDGIKRKEIYLLKDKLKEMMVSRQESENSELEMKKNLRQKAKEQSIIKTMKAEYYNILKKNRIKQFFDRKQKEHYNIVEIKEDQLKELEEIESFLLKKYEQTQKKQEKALNDLKIAITNKLVINNAGRINTNIIPKSSSKLNYSIENQSKSLINNN